MLCLIIVVLGVRSLIQSLGCLLLVRVCAPGTTLSCPSVEVQEMDFLCPWHLQSVLGFAFMSVAFSTIFGASSTGTALPGN